MSGQWRHNKIQLNIFQVCRLKMTSNRIKIKAWPSHLWFSTPVRLFQFIQGHETPYLNHCFDSSPLQTFSPPSPLPQRHLPQLCSTILLAATALTWPATPDTQYCSPHPAHEGTTLAPWLHRLLLCHPTPASMCSNPHWTPCLFILHTISI